jgi:glycosyltransferase involved in cell wall biosynthesis
VLANFLRAEDCPKFLEYLVRSRDPDVVILEQSDFGAALLSHLLGFSSRPLLFCFRHHVPRESEYWAQRFVDEMPQLADETLQGIGPSDLGTLQVDSESSREETTPEQRFHPEIRIPIGVDTARWRPDESRRRDFRAELGTAPNDFVIVFSSGPNDLGETEQAAAVLLELEGRGLPFMATIAAIGSLREWWTHFLAAHQLEHRVRLLETDSPQALRSALAAGDVFFQPGAGGTLQKTIFAMASGLPVVCHEASPFAPLVGASCGGLIEPGTDAEQIESYAILLERLARDEEYRRRLSMAAMAKVDSEHGLDRLGQSIQSALASAKKRSGLGSAETSTEQTREDLVTCCLLAPKLSWASQTYDRHQQLFLELDEFLRRVGSNPDPLAGAQESPGPERRAEECAAPAPNPRIESISTALAKLNEALADLEAEFSQVPDSIAAGVEVPEEPEAASTLRDALRLHWAESNRSLKELAERFMSIQRELEIQIETLERNDPARSET